MRYAYTPTNIVTNESGYSNVFFSYDLEGKTYDKQIPVVGKIDLEYLDTCIQNWIKTHVAQLEAIKSSDELKAKFGSLLGKKVDLTEEQFKAAIDKINSEA